MGAFTCGEFAALTGIGSREKNCDVVTAVAGAGGLVTLIVLDGAYPQGDVAAQWVRDFLVQGVGTGKSGQDVLEAASPSLQKWAESERPDLLPTLERNQDGTMKLKRKMGTCALLADIKEGTLVFSHVGDCRGYLLRRGEDGLFDAIEQTRDHSWVQEEMERRGCSRSEVSPHIRDIVSRMIVVEDPADKMARFARIESSAAPIPLESGDLVLLHSDGVHVLEFEEILKLCNEGGTVREMCERLQARLEKEDSVMQVKSEHVDNYTLLLFQYGEYRLV